MKNIRFAKILAVLSLSIALLCSITSCNSGKAASQTSDNSQASKAETTITSADITTLPQDNENLEVDFSKGNNSAFEISDGWSNGSMFNCTWRSTNCLFTDDVLKLSINKDLDGSKTPYSAAEYRTKQFYGFGTYEVVMKPIKNDGVVSSFFTYTGPSDNNPWDEIDIEFLGKDTTCVQFNYFTNGKGLHEYVYDLGFDASEEFHTYAFKWTETSITWYVDGKEVYTATENIPTTKGKIMMNVWPGTGVDDWLKAFDGKTPITAEYKSLSFTKI